MKKKRRKKIEKRYNPDALKLYSKERR
jgi:hypothetical protein